ncbi:unnamed protein product, partial [Mesorhabditis spiculigera]
MFQASEDGKQRWTLITVVVGVTTAINLGVCIVFRVLLDSEDEKNEPLIKGELRDRMTAFLGVFTMTFFFGCWCCFCCGGWVFQAILSVPLYCYRGCGKVLFGAANLHRFTREERRASDKEQIVEDVVMTARGCPREQSFTREPRDMMAWERAPPFDFLVHLESVDARLPPRSQPPQRTRAYSIDVGFQ